MQLNILVFSFLVSAAVSASVSAAAWRRRSVVGAPGLALLMLAVGWWLLANAFEAAALARPAKIAWSVAAYAGIEAVPVLFLLFVLGWTRQDGRLTRRWIALLLVVPATTVAIAATNELHHLLWPSVTLIDAWGVTAVYTHGPWFWVQAVYSYVLVGAGFLALVAAINRYPAAYSHRIRIAVLAAAVPVVVSIGYVTGLEASLNADMSSIAFAVAGLIAAWAVLRARLLELAPVAWATLVDTLPDAVLVLDPEQRIAAFNPSAARLLGIGPDAAGRAVDEALPAQDVAAVCRRAGDQEVEIQVAPVLPPTPEPEDGDGPAATPETAPAATPETAPAATPAVPPAEGRWFNVRVTAIKDSQGRGLGRLVVLRDVTERRIAVETVRRLSLTDELTGLLNRRGFMNLAEQQLRTALRTRNRVWLLFADLDDLKGINDRLGHEAGDRALREIAGLLKAAPFRESDVVARLGGDEFAVLATEISVMDGETLADRFEHSVAFANEMPGRELALSVSVGVSVFDPDEPEALDELIVQADRRMYRAKYSRGTGGSAAQSAA
jgi:diguanylate cyclase (GGDEF)-like protein